MFSGSAYNFEIPVRWRSSQQNSFPTGGQTDGQKRNSNT